MSALAVVLFFGALTFSEQEVPGIHVGAVKPLSGEVTVNYRLEDFDADGAKDLLFSREVAFQRQGGFPPEARTALPPVPGTVAVDVFYGSVYFRANHRLAVFQWNGQRWERSLDQAFDWPERSMIEGFEAFEDTTGPRLQRFLYDLDHDGIPEIVALGETGLHVYAKQDEYTLAARYDILPPLALVNAPQEAVWPPSARRIRFPARQMSCRLFLENTLLTVLTREESDADNVSYQRSRYHLVLHPEAPEQPLQQEIDRSQPIPEFLSPCRLNGDGIIDYAGGRWVPSTASAFPMLLYETWATLDNGQHCTVRRAPAFQNARPQCSFIDFDGDGDLDMVVEETLLFQGGLREVLNRFITRSAVDHTVQVFTQEAGRFSESPALRTKKRIGVGRPPVMNDPAFMKYLAGESVNITGDFNADGYRDLAIQEEPGTIAVYIASGFSYPSKPEARLRVPVASRFSVTDVNGNGRSDIVLRWTEPAAQEDAATNADSQPSEKCLVFFSREGQS